MNKQAFPRPCSQCGEVFDEDGFFVSRKESGTRNTRCKKCFNAIDRHIKGVCVDCGATTSTRKTQRCFPCARKFQQIEHPSPGGQKRPDKVWDSERLKYLMEYFEDEGASVVANHLGLKIKQVWKKAWKIGLKHKPACPEPKIIPCSLCGAPEVIRGMTICLACANENAIERRRCIDCGLERDFARLESRCYACDKKNRAVDVYFHGRLKEPAIYCLRDGCGNRLTNAQYHHKNKYCSQLCMYKCERYRETMDKAMQNCIEKRAKTLAKNTSKLEEKLWAILTDLGVDYQPQFVVKRTFVVDIKIGSLIIQADGDYWHGHPQFHPLTARQIGQQQKDASQDKYLRTCGFKVERIWESDMTEDVVKAIIEKHKDRLTQTIELAKKTVTARHRQQTLF